MLRVLKKPFSYWYPGTDFVNDIIKRFEAHIDNGDVLAVSEKAISIALGNVYDEKMVKADRFSIAMTRLCNFIWLKAFRNMFQSQQTINLLTNTPLEVAAAHKKLALRFGGVKHFFKPLSEAGIDTSNLPYTYVSLPLKNANRIAEEISTKIYRKLGKSIVVLVVDTDKCYKPKGLGGIAFSTRYSKIRGVFDFGAISYFIGRKFADLFKEYPTPVACSHNIGLPLVLLISRVVERYRGFGLGRNAFEMLENLGKKSFCDVKWADMNTSKHYPAILVKIMLCRESGECIKIDPRQLYK